MANEHRVAKAQYLKGKRAETRLYFSLMADAEIARLLPEWNAEFDARFRETQPVVLDLRSELRRLTAGEPDAQP